MFINIIIIIIDTLVFCSSHLCIYRIYGIAVYTRIYRIYSYHHFTFTLANKMNILFVNIDDDGWARTTVTWSERCSASCNILANARVDMRIRRARVLLLREARDYSRKRIAVRSSE